MKHRSKRIPSFLIILMAAAGCYSSREPEDGSVDVPDDQEAESPETQEPARAACEGPAMSIEELHVRFDELLGTAVCVEGRLDSVGCACAEDWPCTPPTCGYVCSGNAGFKVEGTAYYFIESGWECECTSDGSCITCTPLPCGEPTRVIAVPQLYMDVMRRLEVVEVCFPQLPEP